MNHVYLFSRPGFACPQLDVACNQFIATCMTKKQGARSFYETRKQQGISGLLTKTGQKVAFLFKRKPMFCQDKSNMNFPRASESWGQTLFY